MNDCELIMNSLKMMMEKYSEMVEKEYKNVYPDEAFINCLVLKITQANIIIDKLQRGKMELSEQSQEIFGGWSTIYPRKSK